MLLTTLLLVQATGWTALPARLTVGDTLWLERLVAVPPGWRVRPGKLDATAQVEPLGDAAVRHVADGWVVRYPVVAWTPGIHTLGLPLIWRLGPDGRADSLPGGVASFVVQSVIPDTLQQPEPKGAINPVRPEHRDPLPPLAAAVAASGLLAAGLKWRRRAPREQPPEPQAPLEPEVSDSRWLAAGEPKAVAARARCRLRGAIARAVPEAHVALSTAECLVAVERLRPDAPLRQLRELLEQLDRVAFAAAHGTDVTALAARARSMAREIAP